MKERLTSILFGALVLHLCVSVVFMADLPFLSSSRLSAIYKAYLLPGPFFTDSRIVDTYVVTLSWKENEIWKPPVDPARESFMRYHAGLNPTDLYRSRSFRAWCAPVIWPDSSAKAISDRKEFDVLKKFLYDRYIPDGADSVRMGIIHKHADNFMVRTDSVYVTFFR